MSIIPSLFGGRSSGAFDPLNPFSIEVWDPFPAFPDLAAGGRSGQFVKEASAVANTQIDWKETPKAHIFKADLPGLKKEEVKIALQEDERILQISGKRSKEEEQKNDKWHRIERSRGKFLRRFRLPENVKVEEIKAAMENGVLTLTVPKQPAAQAPQPKSRLIFKAHIFRADLPGLKKEEVKIELQEDQGIVQISGERSKEEEQNNDKWHSIKRSHEKFLRSFRLPENVKVEEMEAAMENGVLTVTVPKQPAAKNPQPKSIKISVPKQPAAKNPQPKSIKISG